MAFITADRVLDSSTSTGTGPFVVSGTPAAGYQTFSSVMSIGDTCYYSIQGQTTSEWEVGLGTYSSANTLTRTTIYSSSNAGSAVTFSAGTKNVFITMAASRSPQLNASGNITALGTPVSATLTNATGLPLTTGVTGVLPSANGGSVAWQSVQTGNFTAVSGNAYPINTTSGAVTVTLPASPSAGDVIQITDYAGTFGTNNCILNPNGIKINAGTANINLVISRESVALVYIDTTQGWIAYSGFVNNPTKTYSVNYLLVAGGGGGGSTTVSSGGGGGGGAGGLLSGSTVLTTGVIYPFVIGSGGTAGPQASPWIGGIGNDTTGFGLAALGGGGGGGTSGASFGPQSGGSGGGASNFNGTAGSGGGGTSGQGNAGGTITGTQAAANYPSAGGGGAGAVGGTVTTTTTGGSGGVGSVTTLITTTQATDNAVGQVVSSSVYFAGGGGGATYNGGTPGVGGSGGGGAAGNGNGNGTSGTAYTGGGGGGADRTSTTARSPGNGGSGVVILSIPSTYYSGYYVGSPVIITNGGNTVLIFKTSGSYTA